MIKIGDIFELKLKVIVTDTSKTYPNYVEIEFIDSKDIVEVCEDCTIWIKKELLENDN